MATWFLLSAAGRRGPFSRDELRRMRAAFEVPPDAIVCDDAGTQIALDELLPEFQTGPLERPPNPRPRSISPPLLYRLGIYPWGAIRALFPALPPFRFRFSLRTLLLCFLFLGPPLGIVSNDLGSRWRQAQIVQPWLEAGGHVGWHWHPWRFWKCDVVDLSARNVLAGTVCGQLDRLPELQAVYVSHGDVSAEQFAEICRARQLTVLSLSEDCRDNNLGPITQLRNLKSLSLQHPDAHLTIRRLRRHPQLERIFVSSNERSVQLVNDLATMPRLRELSGHSLFDPRDADADEYKAVVQAGRERNASSPPAVERFHIAVIGSTPRRRVLEQTLSDPSRKTRETAFGLLVRPEAEYFVATPHGYDLKVISRMLWMADRALIVVDAAEGLTETVRHQCLVARVMKTPDRFLVVAGGDEVSADRRAEVLAECEQSTAELAVNGVLAFDDSKENWSERFARNVALRPPTTYPWLGMRGVTAHVVTSEPTPPPGWDPVTKKAVAPYALLKHGVRTGSIGFDHQAMRPFAYGLMSTPGEEVVLLRDGGVFGLGVLK